LFQCTSFLMAGLLTAALNPKFFKTYTVTHHSNLFKLKFRKERFLPTHLQI
jgi:hypothetical protein